MVKSFNPISKGASDIFAAGGAKSIFLVDSAGVGKWLKVIFGEDEDHIVVNVHANTNIRRNVVGKITGTVDRVGKFANSFLMLEEIKLLLQNVSLVLDYSNQGRIRS